jgi:hypothetical protein
VALEEDPAVAVTPYLVVMAATGLALSCRLHRRRPPPPDPFEALHLQTRLHVIAVEIRQIEVDDTIYARAARLEARSAAYDALLRNACELAGVVDLDDATGRDGRMSRELQLVERGWSW